jgi:hypothetical protein
VRARLASVLLLVLVAGCATPSATDFSGRWRTTWREGNTSMTLVQRGDRVEGDYGRNNGSVFGSVSGRKARGEWVQSDAAGTFEIELAPDGQGFAGTYATTRGSTSSGYWTGIRDE